MLKLASIGVLPAEGISWQGTAVYASCLLIICFLVLLRHQATKQKLTLQNHYMKRLQATMHQDMIKLKSSPERFVTRLGYGQYDGLNKVHASH